jgi:hypothetical protein
MSQQVYYIEQWRPDNAYSDELSFVFVKHKNFEELLKSLRFECGISVCYFRVRLKPVKP